MLEKILSKESGRRGSFDRKERKEDNRRNTEKDPQKKKGRVKRWSKQGWWFICFSQVRNDR